MVMESARWDRNEFSESNLHVYGRDDTKAGIYNMERCTKKKKGEGLELLYNFIIQQNHIIRTTKSIPRIDFLISLVSNRLEPLNLIVFLLG